MRIAVIGIGLIGGSMALAARERLGATVSGHDRSGAALQSGLTRGALDRACDSLADALEDAEVAFVSVPVGQLPELVGEVLRQAPAGLRGERRGVDQARRDGCSRRSALCRRAPAGRGRDGRRRARARRSVRRRDVVLDPGPRTSGLLYDRLYRVLRGLGAQPTAIDAQTHDRILASVSHLPHVLANVLVSLAAGTLAAGGERLPAVGPSFRDATRVAGAPSAVWTDIYLSNRDALTAEIDNTLERLTAFRDVLAMGDGARIAAWNDAAAADRQRVLESQLAGGPLFELRASVPNRPGVIAQLALELGRGGVNITDMALYPAADMSEGVVALWVSGAEAARRTEALVAGLGFPVARA